MARILVLYYSSYGHIEQMAQAAAEGVRAAGGEAIIKRVPELVPRDVAAQAGIKLDQAAPIAEPGELADYDGFLFGTPTRYGNMAAQMRNFLDQTGKTKSAAAVPMAPPPSPAATARASPAPTNWTSCASRRVTSQPSPPN